jgi:membrane protein required for colicin V production
LVVNGVTQFDLLVAALLLISAAVGFARGAAREIAALVALVGAAAFAVFGLPVFSPMVRHVVHPNWLGTVATLVLVFVVTYILLRLVGGALARQIQQSNFIGTLDRSVGLFIGLARGLIVLGALNLLFNAATPKDLQPRWITGATTWPLAQNMGRLLTALAPKGLDIAGRLKPAFDRAVGDAIGDRPVTDGYDARQRGEIDDLVEKSR